MTRLELEAQAALPSAPEPDTQRKEVEIAVA